MKKVVLMLCAIGLIFFSACGSKKNETAKEENSGKMEVYTSIRPIYDFTKKIAGDKCDVKLIAPNTAGLHDYEPSVQDMAKISDSNMFIYSGTGIEEWADNVKSNVKTKNIIEAAKGMELMEENEDEHSEKDAHNEDEHEHTDGHVWLNPNNAKLMLKNICDGLIAADPNNAEYYQSNYDTYAQKCEELNEKLKGLKEIATGKYIIVAHKGYSYFCEPISLKQVAIEGKDHDSEPSSKEMATILDLIKKDNIDTIYYDGTGMSKSVEAVIESTGAKAEILYTYEVEIGEEDYFSIMEKNINTLKEKLK